MRRSGGSGLLDSTIALYAPFTNSQSDRAGGVVAHPGWDDHDSRQFHHRVQLVERSRTSQYVDQHAVVQHCPRCGGRAGGLHRAMGGSCAGAALRRFPPAKFRLYSRLVTVGLAIVAIVFASASIDYWTVMRFFGSRGVTLGRRCLEGPGFFAYPAVLPVRSAFLFGNARVCVCFGDSLRRWFSGPRLEDGSWPNASNLIG